MTRVLISYRRDDEAGRAGRVCDRLRSRFGDDNVFMDVDTLRPGEDWAQRIEEAVSSADVVVAVIGKSWLTITDGAGNRRLSDPDDFLRRELATALTRCRHIIPLVVLPAKMPDASDLPPELAPLAGRQALEISDTQWGIGIQNLIAAIERAGPETNGAAPTEVTEPPPADESAPEESLVATPAAPVDIPTPRRFGGLRTTPQRLAAAAALLLVVGLGVAAVIVLGAGGHGGGRLVVHHYVGLEVGRARREVRSAGFVAAVVRRSNRKAKSGIVFAQDPRPNSRLGRGGSVTLYVSATAPVVAVPDLRGLTLADAEQLLQKRGFRWRSEVVASTAPTGTVAAQEPNGGQHVSKGSLVMLKISNGQPPPPAVVTVPDVRGASQAQATATLEQRGLRVQIHSAASESAAGTVAAEDPGAGTQVKAGTTVVLTVSTGKPKVPDVVGLDYDSAAAKITAAALRPVRQDVSSSQTPGTVIGETPAADTQAEPNAAVTLTVAAPPTPVPNVIDADQGTAANALQRAGFNVRVVRENVTDPSEDGVVLAQNPAGGASLDPGGTVTIVVGQFASG